MPNSVCKVNFEDYIHTIESFQKKKIDTPYYSYHSILYGSIVVVI